MNNPLTDTDDAVAPLVAVADPPARPAARERVIVVSREEIVWPFDGTDHPYVRIGRGKWKRAEKIDPYPSYPHDPDQVAFALAAVEATFPLERPPIVFLLPGECPSRTNGSASEDRDYLPNGKGGWEYGPPQPWIALSAKRIPIHPGVTRYLVGHEYGHCVEGALKFRRGIKDGDETLLDEYAALRGLSRDVPYGAGTWHKTPGEVFACDFRILVAHQEVEYWPHPGVARPEKVPAVVEYWAERVRENDAVPHAAR